MSQPDPARAVVRRARPASRPASAPAAAPLRVVSERVRPGEPVSPESAGPAQLRAGFRDASSASAPLTMAPCPRPSQPRPSRPWPSPTWPPRDAGPLPVGSAPEPVTDAVRRAPAGAAPVRLAMVTVAAGTTPVAAVPPVGGAAELVPARSLLPMPACRPPRPLFARLVDLVSGRRDPAGRHRPGSMQSTTWSMCAGQRRRRSWWQAR